MAKKDISADLCVSVLSACLMTGTDSDMKFVNLRRILPRLSATNITSRDYHRRIAAFENNFKSKVMLSLRGELGRRCLAMARPGQGSVTGLYSGQ